MDPQFTHCHYYARITDKGAETFKGSCDLLKIT